MWQRPMSIHNKISNLARLRAASQGVVPAFKTSGGRVLKQQLQAEDLVKNSCGLDGGTVVQTRPVLPQITRRALIPS